jgi:hypothetical protein
MMWLNIFRKNSKTSSFRGTLRAEESLFPFAFTPGEIPHFVRNDDKRIFSARCEAATHKDICKNRPTRIRSRRRARLLQSA